MPGFNEGGWWVQDLAASLPARLLGAGEGRTVLDLCAAHGGKTMQLAAAGWNVIAVDASAKRLARLRAYMERTGLAAEIVQGDIRSWDLAAPVDASLPDAPCTDRQGSMVEKRVAVREALGAGVKKKKKK